MQLLADLLLSPHLRGDAQVLDGKPAHRGLRGTTLATREERDELRVQHKLLLQLRLRPSCHVLLLGFPLVVLLLLLLLLLLRRLGRLDLDGRAQPPVDEGVQLSWLSCDHEPTPALCAHRRLRRAHIIECSDASVLEYRNVLDLLAGWRRCAAAEDGQRGAWHRVEPHREHHREVMQPSVLLKYPWRRTQADLQKGSLGQK